MSFWNGTFLLIIPPVMAVVAMRGHVSYLAAIFLLYGLPGIYLALRQSLRLTLRALIFAVIVSVPFTIVVDYIGVRSGIWVVPRTIFPARYLGVIPVEDFVWLAIAAFTITVFYQRRIEEAFKSYVGRRMGIYALFSFAAVALFVFSVRKAPSLYAFSSRYAYLGLGVACFLLPAVFLLPRRPEILKALRLISAYFLYLTAVFEFVALRSNYWMFYGSYFLPSIPFFGYGSIPMEELLFVGIVGPATAIALYNLVAPSPVCYTTYVRPRKRFSGDASGGETGSTSAV